MNRTKGILRAMLVASAGLYLAASAYPQGTTTAVVSGRVTGPDGQPLPAIEIRVANQATGVVRNSLTNDQFDRQIADLWRPYERFSLVVNGHMDLGWGNEEEAYFEGYYFNRQNEVIGATVNATGSFLMRADRVGSAHLAAQERALQGMRLDAQALQERIAQLEREAETNTVAATINTGDGSRPCGGLTAAFGSVWVPKCGDNTLDRIDMKTNEITATLHVGPALSEGGLTATKDSVWIASDMKGIVSRIDPETNRVVAEITVPAGTSVLVTGEDDTVWAVSTQESVLARIDPTTNLITDRVKVGPNPRFTTVGAGSIWTLNQGDGSVSRVDMKTKKLITDIAVGVPGGGDEPEIPEAQPAPAESPQQREQANQGLYLYVQKWIEQRRATPGSDLLSKIVNAAPGGQALSAEQTFGMLCNVIFGGLDTVAASLGFVTRWLAENPQARRELIENPALMQDALEEFYRRFGIPQTARVIVKDFVYKGVPLRQGEQVLVSKTLHGLDERRYPDPLRVDFKRKRMPHAAFGDGPHRCPGSFLARQELRIFLEEWLQRIPEFRIKPGAKVYGNPARPAS